MIKMLCDAAGPGMTRYAGDLAEFPADVEARLVAAGMAELVDGAPQQFQTAALTTPQTAARPRPKNRKRT
jgi:hypothetical protein